MRLGQLGRLYHDREAIVREGEVGDCMYVLLDGKAEVLIERADGSHSLAVLSRGAVFGEMALFTRAPRSATVRALGEARILTLNKKEFMAKIHEDPSLAFRILQQMSDRIQALDAEVSRLRGAMPRPVASGSSVSS